MSQVVVCIPNLQENVGLTVVIYDENGNMVREEDIANWESGTGYCFFELEKPLLLDSKQTYSLKVFPQNETIWIGVVSPQVKVVSRNGVHCAEQKIGEAEIEGNLWLALGGEVVSGWWQKIEIMR